MADDPDFKMAKVMLASKHDWPEWIDALRVAAQERRIWERIDPDAPNCDYFDNPPTKPGPPKRPSVINSETLAEFNLDKDIYMIASREYSLAISSWDTAHTHYIAMGRWIANTVKKEYAMAAHSRLKDPEASQRPPNAPKDASPATKKADNMQRLIRELKGQFEPGASSIIDTSPREY